MTPLEALLELLERIGTGDATGALVSDDELSRWPTGAVRELKSQKLLVRASPATGVICPGCEQECTMPVHIVPAGTGKAASFVVCDKRDDINRVPVSAEHLRQWRCGPEAVSAFVTLSLGLRPGNLRKIGAGLWELGVVEGKKRLQMLCLRALSELELVAGNNAMPLAELMRYEAGSYAVDIARVRRLVDTATTGDGRYVPSNARRETRKLATQALHESWRKEYRTLRQRRPEMSDVWYSQQIAGTEFAKGRSAETIRRNMNQTK